MINAGVPLVRSLATLQLQTRNETLREHLAAVAKDVESGLSFADALEKHPKAFSTIYVNMVRAGEAGGILDDILKRLALQQEKDASIRKKVKGAMTYPIILLVIMAGAFAVLMTFVVPTIGKIVKDLSGDDASLPPQTVLLLGLSDFMVKFWYLFIGINVGAVVGFKKYTSTPKGKYMFHLFLLKAPILKTIITKVAIARFARIFSSLMSSGVTVLESISVTGAAIGNLVIEKELKEAAKQVQNGKQLSEPISESKVFPPIVAQMLAIGEETGQTDTILIKVADFYEEEVDTVIDSISSIIEPVMIVLMGTMVGVIAAAVIGPISSLANNIG
jgi:type IV pilus assembly protein PilC